MSRVTDVGIAEGWKALAHATLGGMAALCGGYNLLAWQRRGQRHLIANAAIYALLLGFEIGKTAHHLTRLAVVGSGRHRRTDE